MSFHDKLYKLTNEYADVYKTVTQTQNFKHPFGAFVRHDIVQEITPVVDTNTYLVKGSCGAGRYTTVPWIAVFNKNITTSAQKGVYIVYLLNKDKKELYLTLNQGATDVLQSGSESTDGKLSFTGVTGSSDSSVLFKLRERAEKIRGVVGPVAFNTDSKISCGAPNYDAGAVCYKKYTLDNLPDDTTLLEDLKAFVSIYDKYADWYLNAKNKDIKSAFFKFLGPVDSLNGYQKSYKLVLYKVMFDLMNDAGECSSEEVAKAFRQFYVDRVNAGKVADVDVDKRIEYIKDSSVKDIYNVITVNPFKVISEKGFMFKTNEPFEQEKMCFNADLIDQISDSDLYEIGYIIDKKLEFYFSEIDNVIGPKKMWLLAWNPNNWDWEDFDEAVELVRNGEDYEMGWSCTSKQVNPGDRVFLTVLGVGENNGIIASGTAISETYESEHWDDVKRERGQTTTHIDVRFDCIRDYENESYLMQTKLKTLFPEQQWSPMGSGISIKDIYCEGLENEWQNLIDDAWWPSQAEYPLRLTKDDWKKYILEVEMPNHPSPMKMLKGMMELGGEASCKQLATVYGGHPSVYAGCAMNLGRRVKKFFALPACMDGDQERYFPFPFVGKYRGGKEDNYIYRIRPELFAALKEIDLTEINPYIEEGEKMTTKEKVSAIKNYIALKGFNYEGNLIENFYLSLKSKPFVILAGTSGTGKTRLVKLFAEAIDAKMLLVPVRPDWSDSSDLFGHVDLSGKFNPGAILEFIKEAQENTDKPYFLCLDEMNLARVEYYFSDFLSIIETRENVDGKIVSDPLVDEKYYKTDNEAIKKYGKIIIPENLYIIGTVNMDETTFPFSKKVLDRANTIEFSFVDLMAKPVVNTVGMPRPLNEDNAFLKTEYLYLNDVTDDNTVTTTCFELEQLNQILIKANLHVGYRVRDEITFYMTNNKNADNLISETAAFDNQIMQKILPRIQGSSSAIKEVLIEMFRKCAGDYSGLTGSNTYEQMINCIETKECKYPNSARKIAFMVRRFEEDGFTSYWL